MISDHTSFVCVFDEYCTLRLSVLRRLSVPVVDFIKVGCTPPSVNHRDGSIHLRSAPTPNF